MTAYASRSMVDHLIWVGLSLALANAMSFSVPGGCHYIKQQPRDFSLASVRMPHGCPYSMTCNLVGLKGLLMSGCPLNLIR